MHHKSQLVTVQIFSKRLAERNCQLDQLLRSSCTTTLLAQGLALVRSHSQPSPLVRVFITKTFVHRSLALLGPVLPSTLLVPETAPSSDYHPTCSRDLRRSASSPSLQARQHQRRSSRRQLPIEHRSETPSPSLSQAATYLQGS
jgi:hypothetical protein